MTGDSVSPSGEEVLVRARAVYLILSGDPWKALEELSQYYRVKPPKLEVGLPKRCLHALGCYVPGKKAIFVRSSRELYDPFIILHEYYHHIRYRLGRHRGTEKGADNYALESIRYYQSLAKISKERK